MTYVDRTMTCVDCGVEFIHSAADQEYYAQKGFTSDPKRCASCRAYRRSTRDGGGATTSRGLGGPRGYERTEDRGPARVLRGGLHLVRQPGAGAVQAAHGQAGLLLRLLPADPPGLTAAARAGDATPPVAADGRLRVRAGTPPRGGTARGAGRARP